MAAAAGEEAHCSFRAPKGSAAGLVPAQQPGSPSAAPLWRPWRSSAKTNRLGGASWHKDLAPPGAGPRRMGATAAPACPLTPGLLFPGPLGRGRFMSERQHFPTFSYMVTERARLPLSPPIHRRKQEEPRTSFSLNPQTWPEEGGPHLKSDDKTLESRHLGELCPAAPDGGARSGRRGCRGETGDRDQPGLRTQTSRLCRPLAFRRPLWRCPNFGESSQLSE